MAEASAYRIRWVEDGTEQTVTATADDEAGTVVVELADGQKLTVRATDGRALSMLLTHLVYPVLNPPSRQLVTEVYRHGAWRDLRRWPR